MVIIIGLAKTNWGSDTLKYHQILDASSFKPTLTFPGIIMLAIYNTINSLYLWVHKMLRKDIKELNQFVKFVKLYEVCFEFL
ncbi:hypothetical protein [Mesomycoplasma hyorhinis]|uniref:hypothetical protein n=1 Tax=Mesomycoplasma hyorhinis TaxID=2100 RepID=UPI00136AAF70|nr:hypothetical protein [Mesomycoplasma hyorhinis]MXR58166.1 hypothetical protein [Mesomycoplasma hyorhinis]